MMNWMRPSGNPLETNERPETIAHCESLGWERVSDKPKSIHKMTKEELIIESKSKTGADLDPTLSKPELLDLVSNLDAGTDNDNGA